MATKSLKLTRDQLAAFLSDHQSIKQFEKLFEVVDDVSNSSLQQLAVSISIATSKAQQAIDAIDSILDSLGRLQSENSLNVDLDSVIESRQASNGLCLADLPDVDITTPANGDFLRYDSSVGLWKNAP